MKIGVLGCGEMTEAPAPHWLAVGHEVMIEGRKPGKARVLAERLGAFSGTLEEAAEFGEVVILAVLYPGVETTLREAGSSESTLTTGPGTSLAEQIAATTGARVVKVLNLLSSEVWQKSAR
jgi:predicted dinucleotide-binding enzyme